MAKENYFPCSGKQAWMGTRAYMQRLGRHWVGEFVSERPSLAGVVVSEKELLEQAVPAVLPGPAGLLGLRVSLSLSASVSLCVCVCMGCRPFDNLSLYTSHDRMARTKRILKMSKYKNSKHTRRIGDRVRAHGTCSPFRMSVRRYE